MRRPAAIRGNRHSAAIPRDLPRALLLNECLFSRQCDGQWNGGSVGRDWTNVAERFLSLHPEERVSFLNGVLERWTVSDTFLDRGQNKSCEVLDEIVRQEPVESWHCIARYLDDLRSQRTWLIMNWLSGERFSFGRESTGVIAAIPQDEIFSWVDRSVEARGEFLAEYVPKTLDASGGGHLTRAFLARYGDREDVRRRLSCNFDCESWHGPTSDHLQQKIESVNRWLAVEKNVQVRRWLNEYLSSLEARLEHELVQEERED